MSPAEGQVTMHDKLLSRLLIGLGLAAIATPADAQDAGDAYLRVAAARTKLVDKGDIFVNGVQDPSAGYKTRDTFHGVVTGGYFVVDRVAVEASISTPVTTDNLPADSLAGTPNLGDDEFVVLTLGGSFHPFRGPVSPYVGGGIQLQITTQERDGLGVDLNIPTSHGPYVNAGVDFRINPDWGLFVDVRKAFYHTNASGLLPLDATFTNFAEVTAKAELDPLTIQVGATAHFGRGARPQSATDFRTDNSNWIIRAGFSSLELADQAEMVVAGSALVGEGISTYEHQTPSVQIGYFLTRNLSVAATLGLPPTIDIYGAGSIGALPKLGEITYGPTALMVQYHLTREGRIRPYVGAGLCYMIVFDTEDGAFEDLEVENDLSLAFEAGADFMLGRTWGLFVDVKKAFLRPQATGTFQGAPVEVASKLDPWVFSAGISLRF
jgi:outer membrane protein